MSITVTAAAITQSFPCELTVMHCGQCGGIYAINERYRKDRHEKGESWNCPYCRCDWGYAGKSLNQLLEKQIKEKEDELRRQEAQHDQTKAELRETERRRRAEKGAKTRLKNRINAGTCPCCDQSFEDLASHMKDHHPDFAETAEADESVTE